MVIGDGVTFNHNCMIVVHNNVVIGKGTIFGPGVFIFDHDHDYKSKKCKMNSNYIIGEIRVGENCWIAANVGILKDTQIGNDCVVAAGTILSGNYEDGLLIYNSRNIKSKPIKK